MNPISDRRALHQIPETDFDLPLTLAYIRESLEKLPCKIFSPAKSALCAFFDFGRADAIAFRADMDALPVTEESQVPFASRHPGKMHACGHDGHMAIALELARRLGRAADLPHNVLLVFQPAEETTGGAKLICESGVFQSYNVKAIFGLHLWPDLPLGVVASRPGGMMCKASEVDVAVTGKAAHVAKADQALDAMEAAASWYLLALNAQRNCTAPEPTLLKFGKIQGGTVRNVITGSVKLEGCLRAFSNEVFLELKNQLILLGQQLSQTTGCTFDLHFSEGYPPVRNDEMLYKRVSELWPLEYLEEPVKIAEDFSFYQETIPGLFFFLGCGPAPALHAADFNFDENALSIGAELMWRIAEEF